MARLTGLHKHHLCGHGLQATECLHVWWHSQLFPDQHHQGDHGHLRPCFLAMCLPDVASFSCEISCITNCTCTGHAEDALMPSEWAGGGGTGPLLSRPQPRQLSLCPSPRRPFCSEHASFGRCATLHLMVSVGRRWTTHSARSENAPLSPIPPPCAWCQQSQARPPQSSCVCPWSREGKHGEGLSLLKAHSVFLSQDGNFQNPLSPAPCSWRGPVPGRVHARGWVPPAAGGREIGPS